MRTQLEIRKEIKKVEEARKKAVHKVNKCDDRLDELNFELVNLFCLSMERLDELNCELKEAEQEEAV